MVFLRVAQLSGIQKRSCSHLLLLLVIVGCENEVWNNPHAPAEDMSKIMYREFTSPPKHLDPLRSYNLDEATLIDQIYEPPLEYHYLKRPYELKPLTLRKLPKVEHLDQDGLVLFGKKKQPAFSRYTFKIKKGVMYQPHPAFATRDNGEAFYAFTNLASASEYKKLKDFKKLGTKELVADDYIYQIKRMADPSLQFPIWDIVSEYIVGLKEMRQAVKIFREEDPKAWLNLNKLPLLGVRKIDRYTFSVTLNGIYPQFKYWLAFHFFAPIPMEVDRFYHLPGQQQKNITLDLHPVGTGAFMMTKHDASSEIVLEKNPNYREEYYPSQGEPSDRGNRLLDDSGEELPFIDKIVFRLEKEAIPLWTKFLQGYYDRAAINSDSFDQSVNVSVDGIALSDEMKKKGVNLITAIEPATYYVGFNMLDPIVGGYSERNRKLRQAISIVYDEEEFISIFRNGRGEVAMSPIPPGIFGYQQGEY
ncbi:MAG: peptide ABC transporter substrate-binding protein, partial [Cellvibrionales bacterium TMED148]